MVAMTFVVAFFSSYGLARLIAEVTFGFAIDVLSESMAWVVEIWVGSCVLAARQKFSGQSTES